MLLLLLTLLIIAIVLYGYQSTRKPKNFPPGPRWWPFLGSAPQVQFLRKKTGHLLLATSKLARKYGPIIGLKVGGEQIIIVHGAKTTYSSLRLQPNCVSKRKRGWKHLLQL
ncbi:unnamed protein product [Acanthoscelides obtectus]|uniref:Cytochrome P450 n=1 Tax=Acanthoscelides obtectus TaxID=200917 RepID=A0A9P0M1X5_ACAOB|nr:unnamed protein product [Acanthoscelides obtectus]CAK1645873.1 Probable cytochrome P450 303a1 [Acanthoscelides obtectus]